MLTKFDLPPGFDRRSTEYAAEGRWVDGDKVRSVGGYIQSMGGWDKFEEDDTFLGNCRGLHSWADNSGNKHLGVGTHRRLYIWESGALTNATPIRATSTLTDAITTTNGSAVVNIEDSSHGAIDDAFAIFSAQGTAVDGIDLSGETLAITFVDADNYEVTATSTATGSTADSGGSLTVQYELNPGRSEAIEGFGYGVGAYGSGTYGTPRTTSLLLDLHIWSLDNWGEDLIANPRGGKLYVWDSSAGGRATAITGTGVPTSAETIFVTPERHLVALQASDDPLTVAWSDQEDYTQWTAAASNQAGDFKLSGGSELLAGLSLRAGLNLLWTDQDCHRMTYLGQEPWFSFRKEGSGAGIVGPNAAAELAGVAFWMSDNTFYMYDGRVTELPRVDHIREFVFDSLNVDQREKVFAFKNTAFQEIGWLYQVSTTDGDDIDRYVIFSLRERVWYTGTVSRTAWEDADVFRYPIAAATDGFLYNQEKGEDADGSALQKYVESSSFDLGDGDAHMDIDGFIPDFDDRAGNVEVTVYTRDYPQGDERTDATLTVGTGSGSEREDMRASGRHARVRVESNETGGKFRLGKLRFDLHKAGQRR